jgi:DNA-binding NtrC family response regulator
VNAPVERGSGSILLIDDEDVVLSSTEALLSELGYNIYTANSGQAGIDIYTKNHGIIDLVILDMIMPEMDGSACFSALKTINPQVKIIISSGYATSERIKEVKKLGANTFLQKPYSVSTLSSAVRRELQS